MLRVLFLIPQSTVDTHRVWNIHKVNIYSLNKTWCFSKWKKISIMKAEDLNLIQANATTAEGRRRGFIPLTVFGSFLSLEHMGRQKTFAASPEQMDSVWLNLNWMSVSFQGFWENTFKVFLVLSLGGVLAFILFHRGNNWLFVHNVLDFYPHEFT